MSDPGSGVQQAVSDVLSNVLTGFALAAPASPSAGANSTTLDFSLDAAATIRLSTSWTILTGIELTNVQLRLQLLKQSINQPTVISVNILALLSVNNISIRVSGWVSRVAIQADGSITSPVELRLRLEAVDCLDSISAKPLIDICAGTDSTQGSAASTLSKNLLGMVGPATYESNDGLAAHAELVVIREANSLTSLLEPTDSTVSNGANYYLRSFELCLCTQTEWDIIPNVLTLTQAAAAVKILRKEAGGSFDGYVDVSGALDIYLGTWRSTSLIIRGRLWWETAKVSVAVWCEIGTETTVSPSDVVALLASQEIANESQKQFVPPQGIYNYPDTDGTNAFRVFAVYEMPLNAVGESDGSWKLCEVRSALIMRVLWKPLQNIAVKEVAVVLGAWRPDSSPKQDTDENDQKVAEERRRIIPQARGLIEASSERSPSDADGMVYAAFISGKVSLGGIMLNVSASYSSDTGIISLHCDVPQESVTTLVNIVADPQLAQFYSQESQIRQFKQLPSPLVEREKGDLKGGHRRLSFQRANSSLQSTPRTAANPNQDAVNNALKTIQFPGTCPVDPTWAGSPVMGQDRYCTVGIQGSDIQYISFAATFNKIQWTIMAGFVLTQLSGWFEMKKLSDPPSSSDSPSFSISGHAFGSFTVGSTLNLFAGVAGYANGTQEKAFLLRISTRPVPSGRITSIAPTVILNDPLFTTTLQLPVPAKGETWELPDTLPNTAGNGPDTALESLVADLVLRFSTPASTSSVSGDSMVLNYARASASISGTWTPLPDLELSTLNFSMLMYAPPGIENSVKNVEIHLGGVFTFTPPSSTTSGSLCVEAWFAQTGASSGFSARISAESSISPSSEVEEHMALGMTPNDFLSLPQFGGQTLTETEIEAGSLVIPSTFPVQESDIIAATNICCEIDVVKTSSAASPTPSEWQLDTLRFSLFATATQTLDILPGVLSLSCISLTLILNNNTMSATPSRSILFTAKATMSLGASLRLSTHVVFSRINRQKTLKFSAVAAPADVSSAVEVLTSQPLNDLLPDGAPSLVGSESSTPSLEFGFICVASADNGGANESFSLSEIWVSFDSAQTWTLGPLSLASLSAAISWSSSSQKQAQGQVSSVQFSASAAINSITTSLNILYVPSTETSSNESLSFTILATDSLHLTDLISFQTTGTVPVPDSQPQHCPDFDSIALSSLTGKFVRPQSTTEMPNSTFALTEFDASVQSSDDITILDIADGLSLILQNLSFLWTYRAGAMSPNQASIYALLALGPAVLQLYYSQDSSKNDVYAGGLSLGSQPAEYDNILNSLLPETAYTIDQSLNAPAASTIPMAAVRASITRNVSAAISAQATGGTSNPWTLPFEKVALTLDYVGVDVLVVLGNGSVPNVYEARFTGELTLDSYSSSTETGTHTRIQLEIGTGATNSVLTGYVIPSQATPTPSHPPLPPIPPSVMTSDTTETLDTLTTELGVSRLSSLVPSGTSSNTMSFQGSNAAPLYVYINFSTGTMFLTGQLGSDSAIASGLLYTRKNSSVTPATRDYIFSASTTSLATLVTWASDSSAGTAFDLAPVEMTVLSYSGTLSELQTDIQTCSQLQPSSSSLALVATSSKIDGSDSDSTPYTPMNKILGLLPQDTSFATSHAWIFAGVVISPTSTGPMSASIADCTVSSSTITSGVYLWAQAAEDTTSFGVVVVDLSLLGGGVVVNGQGMYSSAASSAGDANSSLQISGTAQFLGLTSGSAEIAPTLSISFVVTSDSTMIFTAGTSTSSSTITDLFANQMFNVTLNLISISGQIFKDKSSGSMTSQITLKAQATLTGDGSKTTLDAYVVFAPGGGPSMVLLSLGNNVPLPPLPSPGSNIISPDRGPRLLTNTITPTVPINPSPSPPSPTITISQLFGSIIVPSSSANGIATDSPSWPSDYPDFTLGNAQLWYAKTDTLFANTTWKAGYHAQAEIEVFSCLFLVQIDIRSTGVTITNTLVEDINWWFMKMRNPYLSISSDSSPASFTVGTDISFFDFDTTIKTSIMYKPPASGETYPTYEATLVLPTPYPSVSLVWSDGAFGIQQWNFQPYWKDILGVGGVDSLADAISRASIPSQSCSCEKMVDLAFDETVKTKFNFSWGMPTNGSKLLDVDDQGNATLNGSVHITMDIVIHSPVSETTDIPLIKGLDIGTWNLSLVGTFSKDSLISMFINTVSTNLFKIGKAILDNPGAIASLAAYILADKLSRDLVKSLLCRKVEKENVVDAGNDFVTTDQNGAVSDTKTAADALSSAISTAETAGTAMGLSIFSQLLVSLHQITCLLNNVFSLMDNLYQDGGLAQLLTAVASNSKAQALKKQQIAIMSALDSGNGQIEKLVKIMEDAMILQGAPKLTLNDPPLVPDPEILLVDWTGVVANSLNPDSSQQLPPEISSLVWNVLLGTTNDPSVATRVATVEYPATTASVDTSSFTVAETLYVWVYANLSTCDKTVLTAAPSPVVSFDFVPRTAAPTSVAFVMDGLSTSSTTVSVSVEGVDNGGTYGLYVVPAGVTTTNSPLFFQSTVVNNSSADSADSTAAQLTFPLLQLDAIPSSVTGLDVLVQQISTDVTKIRRSAICVSSQSLPLLPPGDFSDFQGWTTYEVSSTAMLQWTQPRGQSLSFDLVVLDSLTSKTPLVCTPTPDAGGSAALLGFNSDFNSEVPGTLFVGIRQQVNPAQAGSVIPYLFDQASITHQPKPVASAVSYDATAKLLSLTVILNTAPLFSNQTILLTLQPKGTIISCNLAAENQPPFLAGVPVAITAALAQVDNDVLASTNFVCVALKTPGSNGGQPTVGPWSSAVAVPSLSSVVNIPMNIMIDTDGPNTISFYWSPPEGPALLTFIPMPDTSSTSLAPVVKSSKSKNLTIKLSQLGGKPWEQVSFLQTTSYTIPGVTNSTVSQTFTVYRARISSLALPGNTVHLSHTENDQAIMETQNFNTVYGSGANSQYVTVLYSGYQGKFGAVTVDTQASPIDSAGVWEDNIPNAAGAGYGLNTATFYDSSINTLFLFWPSPSDGAIHFVSTNKTPAQHSGNTGSWTSESIAPFSKANDATTENSGAIAALDCSNPPMAVWQGANNELKAAYFKNSKWSDSEVIAPNLGNTILNLELVQVLQPPGSGDKDDSGGNKGATIFGALAFWTYQNGSSVMMQIVGSETKPVSISPSSIYVANGPAIHQILDSDGVTVVLVFFTDVQGIVWCSMSRMDGNVPCTPGAWSTICVATKDNPANTASPICVFCPTTSTSSGNTAQSDSFLVTWWNDNDYNPGMMVAVPSVAVDAQTNRKSLVFSVQAFPAMIGIDGDPTGIWMKFAVAVVQGKPNMWLMFPMQERGWIQGVPFTCEPLPEIEAPDL